MRFLQVRSVGIAAATRRTLCHGTEHHQREDFRRPMVLVRSDDLRVGGWPRMANHNDHLRHVSVTYCMRCPWHHLNSIAFTHSQLDSIQPDSVLDGLPQSNQYSRLDRRHHAHLHLRLDLLVLFGQKYGTVLVHRVTWRFGGRVANALQWRAREAAGRRK